MAKRKRKPKTSGVAWAYYRMSSDKQETSIDQQREAVKAYAKTQGYKLTTEYDDQGISGDATEKRFGFQRMIADAATADVEVILCWDQSRFGRFDLFDAGFWIKPLRDHGVRLETVSEGRIDWEDLTGQLIFNVNQLGKAQYLRDLSKNITRGRAACAKRGDWPTLVPHGYKLPAIPGNERRKGRARDPKYSRLILGSDEAVKAVQTMFEMYANGHSLTAVRDELNRLGLPTARGSTWSRGAVCNMLRNPTYLGHTHYNKFTSGKYSSVAQAMRADGTIDGDSSVHVVKNTHPPLISKSTWDKVQRRREQNRKRTTPHKEGGAFVLTGLMKCGHCGSPLIGRRRDQAITYTCGGYNDRGADYCPYKMVRQDAILGVMVAKLQETYSDRNIRKALAQAITSELKAAELSTPTATSLKRRLSEVERNIKNGAKRICSVPDDLVDNINEELERLRNERDEIVGLIEASSGIRKTRKDTAATVQQILAELESLAEGISAPKPYEVRETLLQSVDAITVWWSDSARRWHHRDVARGVIQLQPFPKLQSCRNNLIREAGSAGRCPPASSDQRSRHHVRLSVRESLREFEPN